MTPFSDPLVFFKISPNPCVLAEVTEKKLIITLVNDAFEQSFGVKEADLIGTEILQLPMFQSSPDYLARLSHSLDKVKKTGLADSTDPMRLSNEMNNCLAYYSTTNTPLYDKDKLTNILLTFTDYNNYMLLIEHTEEAFVLVDKKLEIELFNTQFALQSKKLLGKEVKKGNSIIDYVDPERRETLRKLYERVLNGEKIKTETELISEEGRTLIISNSFTPIYRGSRIEGAFISSSDVSEVEFERKNKEALINNTSDAIWSVNREKKLITANNAFIHSLEIMTGKIFKTGDTVLDAFPKDLQVQWNKLYDRALSGESFNYEINAPDVMPGLDYWYEASLDPIFENGRIIGIACRSHDITEAKNSQKNLLDINKKLETAQKIGKFGYIELNYATKEFYWSDEVYEIWGVSAETFEITVENFLSAIHPGDLPALLKEMDAAEKNLQDYDFEYRIVLPSGEIKWIHELGKRKQGIIKEQLVFEGTVQDITEHKLSIEEIKKQKEFIETSFDNLPVGIVVNKADTGEAILMNKKFSEIYGWPEEEIRTADMFFERIWPDEVFRKNMVEQIKTDVMSGDLNKMNWYAIPITTQSGEQKIINSRNIPLFDQNLVISSVVDVTEEIKAKKEKEQILESISDAFCALDENWNYTYVNHEVERILNVQGEDLIGKNIWKQFPDIVDTELYRNFIKTESEKVSATFEFYYPPFSIWFEISAYPAQKGITAYFKDITEKRNYILKLEDFNARLRKIAWMQSHVVRAPVARIMGLVNLIQASGYQEEPLKEMLDHIQVSAKELDGIIQEIVKNTGKLDME